MPFIFDLDAVTVLSETGGGTGGGGTTNYNQLTNKPSINGVILSGNKTTIDLGLASSADIVLLNDSLDVIDADIADLKDNKIQVNTEIDDINEKLNNISSGVTEDFVNSSINNHNLSDQSHNDIRNSVKSISNSLNIKANLASQENAKIGNIAIVDKDGQYEVSDTKLSDLNDDIDIINQQIGTFISTAQDSALKSQTNTFTKGNTFSGGVVFDTNPVHLTNGASIKNGVNDKSILNTITINDNTQQTYLGGDQVWVKGTDQILLEGSEIKTKRGTDPSNWTEYINIDSGNINQYVSSAGVATVLNDKYGIQADYATHYGILDCPNGLINYSINNKEVEIQPNVVLQMAGSDTKTMIASKTKYEIEETGKVTLFFTKTVSENGTTQLGFLEAGDVFYQEEEPSNGTTSFLAWWKPSLGIWQFKSNYTGNVWRTAVATPIANINAGATGITSINYIGYRIIDDDIFAQLSDIESINDTISTINTNINDLQLALNSTVNLNSLKNTEIDDLDTIDKTIIGSINELEVTKADISQLPQSNQLMNGNAPSIPDFDTEITEIKTLIISFNAFLAQLRTRGVIN